MRFSITLATLFMAAADGAASTALQTLVWD